MLPAAAVMGEEKNNVAIAMAQSILSVGLVLERVQRKQDMAKIKEQSDALHALVVAQINVQDVVTVLSLAQLAVGVKR